MLNKLLIAIATFTAWAVFSLAFVLPAAAQTSTNQIVGGLCQGANLQVSDNPSSGAGSCSSNGESVTDKVNRILKRVVNFLSALIGVVAVIMIIFGGFRYITSGGSDTSVTSAKNTILYAIIGLVIVALAQLIVRFIVKLIGS
jgi:hypothetical protein